MVRSLKFHWVRLTLPCAYAFVIIPITFTPNIFNKLLLIVMAMAAEIQLLSPTFFFFRFLRMPVRDCFNAPNLMGIRDECIYTTYLYVKFPDNESEH